jgi:cobalt-zinc-cadmium efflux system outer membrane protein
MTCFRAIATRMSVRTISIILGLCLALLPCFRASAQQPAAAPPPTTAAPAPMPATVAQPAATTQQPSATTTVATTRVASALQPEAAPSARLLQDDRALGRWVAGHSQDVAAAQAELNAARAAGRGSRLLPNPVVDLAVSNLALGETNPRNLGLAHTLIYGVGLSETFELGKRGPRTAAASLRARAAEGRASATLGERVADARLALARLIYAQARAQELDASLLQARAAANVAKGRLDHQALSGVDYDRLLIDLVGIQTEAAHAHADADAANAECAAALLAPCNLVDVSVDALTPAATVPAAWQESELAGRADVKALRFESTAARRDADVAAARALPDLTFRLGYTRDTYTSAGDIGHTLGLSVSAPLPFFDHGQHAKAEALAHASQYSALAQGTLVRARGDVTSLFTRKLDVEAALALLEQDALPRANGVLKAEESGLREGQLDITDLLLARRAAIALRLQTLELRFELFSIRNELRQALGLDEALAQR